MNNTLQSGQRVAILKGFYTPELNDIFVFRNVERYMIKRCVAMPGDTILIKEGNIMVNGIYLPPPSNAHIAPLKNDIDPQSLSLTYKSYGTNWTLKNFGPYIIPKKNMVINLNSENRSLYGELLKNEVLEKRSDDIQDSYTFQNDYYFLVGDNRYNSEDSRMFGPVAKQNIIGKVFIQFVKPL